MSQIEAVRKRPSFPARETHKHVVQSPVDREAKSSSLPSSRPRPHETKVSSSRSASSANPPENAVKDLAEYEHQLAHLSMLYPDLDEAECRDVLELCKGNLARAAEVVVRLNLVSAGPTISRESGSALVPELHSHLNNHRHNYSSSKQRTRKSGLSRAHNGLSESGGRHAVQSPPCSPPDSPKLPPHLDSSDGNGPSLM